MICSGSLVARQIGKASTPPRYLNKIAFPSITGSAAWGPISPSPSTRVPSETTATKLALLVCANTRSGCWAISRQGAATPGVYQIEKSLQLRMAHFGVTSSLPRYNGCSRMASSPGFCALAKSSATFAFMLFSFSTLFLAVFAETKIRKKRANSRQ